MNRIEVITSVERRRRWSRSEKETWVAALMKPGANATEVAKQAGIDRSLLYRWRQQLAASQEGLPAFVPVTVAPSMPEPAPVSARAAITIAFGANVRMTIEGSPDETTLANVIGALAGDRRVRTSEAPREMIAFPSGVRVWLATGHTDMRKGFGSLAVLVQETLKRNPHAGDLYVFRGRQGDLLKIIWHDGQGACLFTKRLERGRFLWPSIADGVVTISSAQLSYLLSGIDWRMPQKTWRPEGAG
jgi:transposase